MSCMLEHGSKSTLQDLFVVKQNLLGLPAIEALEIIKRVINGVLDSFSSLFNGLGTLRSGEYEIKIKPAAIFTARHVPFPLQKKVQKELMCMEELGVISKAEQPSE